MPKKSKILIYSDVEIPSYSRPYRSILYVDNLDKNKEYEIHVVSPKSNIKFKNNHHKILKHYFNHEGISLTQYSFSKRISGIIKLFINLISLRLKNYDLDVIRVGSTYLILMAIIFKNNKTKIIADVCDFYSDLYVEYNMPFSTCISRIINLFEILSLKIPDIIFVDTRPQKILLERKYKVNPNKCVVLPNGILIDNFPYTDEKNINTLRSLGYNKEDLIIFYGGDISEVDGINFILDFAEENKNKKYKYLIIGKGKKEYILNLKNEIVDRNLQKIVKIEDFKPYSELHKYISIADICLAPFKITNTTNVMEVGKIITYLLMGKKVLSTNAKGVKSLYKENIEYYENENYCDFRSKLNNIILNKSYKEDANKRRKFAEKFDFVKIIKTEYKIVEEVIKNKGNKNINFEKYNF